MKADVQNKNQRIARNTILLTIRMIFVLFISLYTSRVVLQSLGVEDFGVYNVVCGFVSMFSFLNSSMANCIQRYYNDSLGRDGGKSLKEVYITSVTIQIVLSIVIIVLTETIGLWYLYNKMVIPPERFTAAFFVFQFSVVSMLLVILQVPYVSAIMAFERMDFYAIVTILDALLKLVIVLVLPFFKGDALIVYGALVLLISVLDFLLYFVYAKKKIASLSLSFYFNKQLFVNMLSFSGWNVFGTFAQIFKEQGLNMILNLFFGPIVNAARAIAYQVVTALKGFVENISTAARPQFTQSYAEGNSDRTINLMFSTGKVCYLVLFLLSLPMMIEVDIILRLWLGETIPEHTSSFVVLVIISSLIMVFNPSLSFVVHATGKMKTYQVLGSLVDVIVIPFAYIIMRFGAPAEAVFVVTIVFALVKQIVCTLIVKRLVYFSISNYLKDVIIPVVIVSVLSLVPTYFIHNILDSGFLRLVIVCVTSTVSVAVFSFLFSFNKSEKNLLMAYVHRLRKK